MRYCFSSFLFFNFVAFFAGGNVDGITKAKKKKKFDESQEKFGQKSKCNKRDDTRSVFPFSYLQTSFYIFSFFCQKMIKTNAIISFCVLMRNILFSVRQILLQIFGSFFNSLHLGFTQQFLSIFAFPSRVVNFFSHFTENSICK